MSAHNCCNWRGPVLVNPVHYCASCISIALNHGFTYGQDAAKRALLLGCLNPVQGRPAARAPQAIAGLPTAPPPEFLRMRINN